MINVGPHARIYVSALAIGSMLVHSGGETASLVGIATGGALLLVGLWAMVRVAAVGGFLIAVGVTAHFTELDTMTDLQNIVFASVALFIPALVMGWAALTAEHEYEYPLRIMTRQALQASLFAVLCMAAVPATMVMARVMTPSMSFGPSTMLEIAIILVAASIPMIYFFTQEPRTSEPNQEDAEPE